MNADQYTRMLLTGMNFVVIDLETTGLDPEHDDIIEIGMVHIDENSTGSCFQSLFDPGYPVPEFITRITGIAAADCAEAPKLADNFDEVMEFAGSRIVIAHNARFDLGFLKKAYKKEKKRPGRFPLKQSIDTLELSRMLLPHAASHRLESLVSLFSLDSGDAHRALSDARACAGVFLALINQISELDAKTLYTLAMILGEMHTPLAGIFKRAESWARKQRKTAVPNLFPRTNSAGRRKQQNSVSDQTARISEKTVAGFFAPCGMLAAMMDSYEPRIEQQELAAAAARAFNRNEFLLAEAGTGVGKSLGYLIPSLVWAEANPQDRIIISTNTKNLQEQLFYKDLPPLLHSRPVKAVLLKGRGNYLCRLRWEHMISQGFLALSDDMRMSLLSLVLWANSTKTGDIEENPGFRNRYTDFLWSQLNADSVQCKRSRCPFAAGCFYQRVKNAAMTANIVVVNHSLMFSDIAANNQILGPYQTLIIDEAHHAEESASSCLTTAMTMRQFSQLNARISTGKSAQNSILFPAADAVNSIKDQDAGSSGSKLLSRLRDDGPELNQLATAFFDAVFHDLQSRQKQGAYSKIRLNRAPRPASFDAEETDQIKRLLRRIPETLDSLATVIQTYAPETENRDILCEEMSSVASVCSGIAETFVYFTGEYPDDDVVWAELIDTPRVQRADFYKVPLDIGSLMSQVMYPGLKRCIMTSATLKVGDSFEYIKTRLGLDHLPDDRVRTAELGSPFDYDTQALMLLPSFLPDPRDQDFTIAASRLIEELILASNRGTLVLFTSYAMLKAADTYLSRAFADTDITLFSQQRNVSRTALLDRFRSAKNAVFLATSSFWEGIDVPGASLEQLVIVKLPFSMPAEPVVAARTEDAQNRTGNGFLNYSVPEAVVRLRQGTGRLIRSGTDRGVVIFLDRRLRTTSYGRLFTASLPSHLHTVQNRDEFIQRVTDWFDMKHG